MFVGNDFHMILNSGKIGPDILIFNNIINSIYRNGTHIHPIDQH